MSTPNNFSAKVTIQASAASVREGSVAKLTVMGDANAQIPYFIIGLTPEDIIGGAVNGRVVLDDLGIGTINVGIAADSQTEGTETLIVNAANSFAIMSVEDTSKAATTYFLSASEGVVDEGKVVTFTISAENAVPGTRLPFTITGKGLTAKDVSNGKLSGSVAIGTDSTAIITIPIKADASTEGDEELTLTLTGRDAAETVIIDDTSTEAVVAASYTVWPSEAAVEEGSDAEFQIETAASEAGKLLKWTLTGVSAADVADKKLTGTVAVGRDGTATIIIPTATDALTEGNETLTLTVNGQTASAALLDNKTIRVASVIPGSDTQGTWGLYRLGDGAAVIAEAGLTEGDELGEYVPLRSSPSKNYSLPKTIAGLISYDDGSFGLLSRVGVNYTEQRFSDAGIAKGSAIRLTAGQLLAKESEIGTDLNGDGIAGDAIATVLDGDGDPTQQEYGLYRSVSGAIAVAQIDLNEGDELIDPLMLLASKGKLLAPKPAQTVLGLAQTSAGDWEILLRSGNAFSTQAFDAQTGVAKGKVVSLKPGDLAAKESQYDLDLTGDGEIGGGSGSVPGGGTSGGGQTTTTTAGSETNKIILQTAGVKDLASRDLNTIATAPGFHQALVLGASGGPGTVLNIHDAQGSTGLSKPLIIGAASANRQSATGKEADKLLSANNLPFPGIFAGIGSGQQGTVNVKDAEIYFTGGPVSTYLLNQFGVDANDEFAQIVLAGIASGFLAESRGVVNITDSNLYFLRNRNPADVVSSDSDILLSLLIFGTTGGGNGVANIRNSTLTLKGTENGINVGELGSSGKMTVNNSHLLLAGQYSSSDKIRGGDDLANAFMFVGSEEAAAGSLEVSNKSTIRLGGLDVSMNVGTDIGRGAVDINNSRVELIAKRSAEPVTRQLNPLTWNEYADVWSGAYLVIGYDQDDGSAKTNGANNGQVTLTNDSLLLVRGPHAGIEVGGSGTRSAGTLTIDGSLVEVSGSGAIQKPNTSGDSPQDYLSADDNGDYFTFMNIGGSAWKDFGGSGVVSLKNGAELKLYGFDITSGDTLLEANRAYLNLGDWGTKAALNIDGSSKVSVAGQVRLGTSQDMAQSKFNTDSGLGNVSNYSMVNISGGDLHAYSYNSAVTQQSAKSPLTNYGMYTVLENQGTLVANQLGFYKNSQIIGSGTIVLDDVFSKTSVSLHSDINTASSHTVKDAGSDGFMMVDQAELLIGDALNFDNLGRRPQLGTLTISDQTAADRRGSLTIEDSTFVFDISKGQADKLIIEGFDYCSINRNNFVITGSDVASGQKFVLIDFRLQSADDLTGDLEQLLNLKLIGVKGELSFDESALDVVFTVF